MKKFVLAGLVVVCMAVSMQAATVTNRLGQVITVTKLSDSMAASSVVAEAGTAGGIGQLGVIVEHYKYTSGDSNAVVFGVTTVPKGAILLGSRVIEVTTGMATATNYNVSLGGVSVVAAGTALNSTGIVASTTPVITTSAGKMTLNITGALQPTAGEFTVQIPYVMGTAQ